MTCENDGIIEKYFPIVRVSTLSLEDEFLKHKPETYEQLKFKEKLIFAIESGLVDFRAQRIDATFDGKDGICFCEGMPPAVGNLATWWNEKAEKFMPEKQSRLGTTKERIAFLGLLIKYLIEEAGYTESEAWHAVCDHSDKLGHYWDSKDAKHDFETTGSRKIGEWYDLANTYKITFDDEEGCYSIVGGNCYFDSCSYPLAHVNCITDSAYVCRNGTGWVVTAV